MIAFPKGYKEYIQFDGTNAVDVQDFIGYRYFEFEADENGDLIVRNRQYPDCSTTVEKNSIVWRWSYDHKNIYFDRPEKFFAENTPMKDDKLIRREATLDELRQFTFTENGQIWVPDHVVQFKDIVAPVYVDDYGQQDFIRVDGQDYGAGAYNFYPDEYFEYELRHIWLSRREGNV